MKKANQPESLQKVLSQLETDFPGYIEELKRLIRIPSVSFPGFPREKLEESADAVSEFLKKSGFENIRKVHFGDAPPYVLADKISDPKKPTLLLYAHHDVQPPGREAFWKTPPFEPVENEGPGGLRIYARGSADDKAGVLVHAATLASFQRAGVELPVNLKVVIEGEEEIGSEHLQDFLTQYKDELQSDVLILTDTMNFDCGVPGLTVALRGMVGIDVEVRALSKTVHSGMWGGPVPDPAMGLSKMLSSLVDDQGQIAVPGVLDHVRPVEKLEREAMEKIPFDSKAFREQCGMVEGTEFLSDPDQLSPVVQIWRKPSLTVNAIEASSRQQAGNIINDTAWSKVTIRIVDDMDPERVRDQVIEHLRAQVPWGLEVKFEVEACAPAWSTIPKGLVFEAADRALENGYGKPPLKIGCGGSIPFVKPFAEALQGAPALLIGVEDPYTNAHGENESVLISDLKKACLSEIHLFWELGKLDEF